MTERQVKIGISVAGGQEAEDRLAAIRKQMDEIQGTVLKSRLQLDIQGQEQLTHFRRQLAAAQTTAQSTLKVNVEGGDQVKALQSQILKAKSQAKNIDIGTTYRQVALFQPTEKMAGAARARMAAARPNTAQESVAKDFSMLGSAITAKAIPPLAQYQAMLGGVLRAGMAIGPGLVSSLGKVSAEFTRQRELAKFWGISGFQQGIISFKSALSGFLSGSGTGFTSWLQNASANLAQYRTALTVAAAAMVGVAAAAALSSKHSKNLISSVMDSKLVGRKFGGDGSAAKEDALKWIESAQGNDLVVGGRESRMKTLQTVLSKNKAIGGEQAKKVTQDIEKYFFANQEELQGRGIANAADLASKISAPQLTGDDAAFFEDKFGLGFANISAQARLGRIGVEAQGIDPEKELAKRPDVVLGERVTKTTQAMGDAVLPALNAVLGGFIKLSDIIGKIPGLGKAMGWGAVLLGAASAGLVVVSMLGSLIPGLLSAYKAFQVVTAGIKVMGLAMAANPLGLVLVAVAALAVGLYYLETRFGILSKTYKAFAESSIGKGIFAYIESGKKAISEMLGSLGKAYASGGLKGVMHLALDALAANSPGLKVLLMIADFIRKLWQNSSVLNKIASAGSGLLTRIVEFFSWLLDSIKSGLQWIRDGLGVTRSEAKGKMDEQAKKDNMWLSPEGWRDRSTGALKTPSDRLVGLQEKYEASPKGFFEGIPGINELTNALKANTDALTKKVQTVATNAAASVASVATAAGIPATAITAETKQWWLPSGESFTDEEYGAKSIKERNILIGQGLKRSVQGNPFMERGGSIIGSGSIIGHAGEQVNPASVVAGGETVLEKINKMFSGKEIPQSGQSINFAPVTTINLHVDKIDSSIDLERALAKAGDEFDRKLLFRLRNPLDNSSTRGIGYLRG